MLAEATAPTLYGPGQAGGLARLEREHDNLRAALARFAEQGAVERSLRLGAALEHFWYVRGHLSEGRRWLETALAGAAIVAAPVRANALAAAGVLAHYQGDYPRARELQQEALALRRGIGDRPGIADCLQMLGLIAESNGDYAAAERYFAEGLALRRALGEPRHVAMMLLNLTSPAQYRGDHERARALIEESLVLSRQAGDQRGIGYAYFILAEEEEYRGDFPAAARCIARSLALFHAVGDPRMVAQCLERLTDVAGARADPARAARLFGAAAALREAAGAPMEPTERRRHDPLLAAARAALGERAFAAAWDKGRALPAERAVAEALAGAEAAAPMPAPAAPEPPAPPRKLTVREVEVLRLVAEGLTNAQVAERLFLSPKTVARHLDAIYTKLDVPSRTAVARFAIDHGIV